MTCFTTKGIFLLLLFSTLMACGNDSSEDQGPQLEGRWEIDRALRNGRPAESLAKLFFEFGKAASFTTNISGEVETGTYEVIEHEIATAGISLPMIYKVNTLTDSTLVMKSSLSRYRFEFFLRRAPDQTEVPNT
jgi:hypothetical protein